MIARIAQILSAMIFVIFTHIATADTLSDIKERGTLVCGVSQGLPGFSYTDDSGNWVGFDVEMCKAIATAIFNNPNKVQFRPLSAKERFTALQSGEIDVLSRNTTWTLHRDVSLGIEFTGITFYDGQGFLIPKNLGINSAKELAGATVCTNAGTTTELNVADYFRANNIPYEIVTYEKVDEVIAAYQSGRCDAYTTDRSGLAGIRLKLADPDAHMILPDTISKEPLAIAVRQNEGSWADLVRWVINGVIEAEELGINSSNINTFAKTKSPILKRFLGVEANYGASLGLNNDFMKNVISKVGNYEEIYNRNFGTKSKIQLARGKNKLWKDGGLMYSPPFR